MRCRRQVRVAGIHAADILHSASARGRKKVFAMTHVEHPHGARDHEHRTNPPAAKEDRDPVCGMSVKPDSPHQTTRAGRAIRFCSANCLAKFESDPQRYLTPTPGAAELATPKTQYTCPMHPEVRRAEPGACPKCGMALERETAPAPATRTEYTCPMHPQIVRDAPGACPICGMALEPRTAAVEAEESPELVDMTRRFWVVTLLAIPVFISAMAAELWPETMAQIIHPRTRQWLELIVATPAVVWGGWIFFVRAWRSVVTWNLNMFTLIGLGVAIAWGYSVVATLAPGIFPASVKLAAGQVPVYFEAAAVITALVLLGQVLELRARSRTSAAIKMLLGLAPKTARLVREDGTEED
ncbi:MAG: heavy metal-binding domain-containing protein, partial [Chromatiaceae bacterium]